MYEDPRDEPPKDPHEVLTEDSDDAFADLEKEFAVRKQKLMEERARKRERTSASLQVERSPSPKRIKDEDRFTESYNLLKLPNRSRPAVIPQKASPVPPPLRAFQKVPTAPSDQFAARLFKNENETSKVNYNERKFEFENIPKAKQVPLNEGNSKDSVSGELLRRRNIEEHDVNRLLKDIKILRVTKLLAKILPPKYEEPAYTNWGLTGIIVYKSDPKTAATGKKYMTLRVGNFNHTVDLFLFGDAFKKFWKLRCGDIVAVLNPTVKKYGAGFSLSLQDDLDSVLEIGASKNYGHCSATNKSGDACKNVVDLSKNVLCSFHEESKFKNGSRMELQGSVKPKAPTNKQGQTSQAFFGGSSNQPAFVEYTNAGFSEKDAVYSGGEQFNEAKYDRPVKESAAAKLRKRKANEKLRLQLINSAAPSRLNDLDKLGIVQQKESEVIKRQNSLSKIKSHAFKNKFLTGMGYDPTFEKSQRLDKVKPTKSMEELRSISKTKKVSLEPSEEEQRKRRQKQKTVMGIIRPGNATVSRSDDPVGPKRRNLTVNSPLRTPPRITSISDDENGVRQSRNDNAFNGTDSDSDLEISFASSADQMRYKKVISAAIPNSSEDKGSEHMSKLLRD